MSLLNLNNEGVEEKKSRRGLNCDEFFQQVELKKLGPTNATLLSRSHNQVD